MINDDMLLLMPKGSTEIEGQEGQTEQEVISTEVGGSSSPPSDVPPSHC